VRGWYVSGTWVVAGATGAADVDQPARPLFQGGYGSIQVAMRLERLSFGSIADTNSPSTSPRADVVLGNRETAMTLGATWHLNRWIKIEGNVVREQIGGTAVSPVPNLRVWSRLIRFQLAI